MNKLVITRGSTSIVTIDDATLMGGVSYTHTVNPDTDLQVGIASSARITFTTVSTTALAKNDKIVYSVQQANDSSYRQLGIFYITDMSKYNGQTTVTAYDSMILFDIAYSSDPLSSSVNTVYGALSGACTKAGVTLDSGYLTTNNNVPFTANSAIQKATYRQLIQWIAAVKGGFARITAAGKLTIKTYTANATSVTASKYTKLSLSDLSVPALTTVAVQTAQGYIYGTGARTNVANMDNNQIFINQGTNLPTYIDNLVTNISGLTYYPATINLFEDFGISAGEYLTINSKKVLVMSKVMDQYGCTLSCTGAVSRVEELTNNDSLNYSTGTVSADLVKGTLITPDYLYYTGDSSYGIPQYRMGRYTDGVKDLAIFMDNGGGAELHMWNIEGLSKGASLVGFELHKAIIEWKTGTGSPTLPVMQIVEVGTGSSDGFVFTPAGTGSPSSYEIKVVAGSATLKNMSTSATGTTITGYIGTNVMVYNVGSSGVRVQISTN